MRIGLISDTHSYIDEHILQYLNECDEIWHAGDIGDRFVSDTLLGHKEFKAVYGNIDHGEIRFEYPKDLFFEVKGLKVFITHIGGYPGKYSRRVKEIFEQNEIDLFICGHSHICKVMFDKKYDFLHINPGACGVHGFHQIRTMVRFTIEEQKITDLQVIELGPRVKTNIM